MAMTSEELEGFLKSVKGSESFLEKIKDEKTGQETTRLKLDFFNKQVELSSNNIGYIVPAIVDVSKEQVAVINKGLEGVINFIQAFQISNSFFAMMTEAPEKIKEYSERFNFDEIQNLENYLIKDVNSTLKGLDNVLKDTFKEINVYYNVLAQIIYAEEEGREISIDVTRTQHSDAYKRKVAPIKGGKMTLGLGLVQIIETFDKLSKELGSVKISKDESKTVYNIKTSDGKEIPLDIDILQSLKGLSSNLISSLEKVGYIVQEETDSTNKARRFVFRQKELTAQGVDSTNNSIELVKKEKGVVEHFNKLLREIGALKELASAKEGKESVKITYEINKLEDEKNKFKKVHDEIVKEQIKTITNTVNIFKNIVSVWGEQVTEEVHIGQVAGKCVNVLEHLANIEVKQGNSINSLLLAQKTQNSIKKTCEQAADLQATSKVMIMLLERVNALLSFNKMLEENNMKHYKDETQMRDYRKDKMLTVKKIIGEKYPEVAKAAHESIKKFTDIIKKLGSAENLNQNRNLVIEYNSYFNQILDMFAQLESSLSEASVRVDISNFEEFCKELNKRVQPVQDDMKGLSKNFNDLKTTFSDDFKSFKELFVLYTEFTKTVSPLLDMISYIIDVSKTLSKEKIELKTLNIRIRGFKDRFERFKTIQSETSRTSEKLEKVMKSVGLNKNYYEDFEKRLGENFKKLLHQLDEELKKDYFSQAKVEKEYAEIDNWLGAFKNNFTEIKGQLSGMRTGMFDKIFNTTNYKQSAFWSRLNTVEASFKKYDALIDSLKSIKLTYNPNENVKSFCNNSVILVNNLLKSFEQITLEIYTVLEVMSVVTANINSLISTGYFDKFKNMVELVEKFNTKLEKIEEDIDLKEFNEIKIDKLMNVFKDLTGFETMAKSNDENAKLLNENNKKLNKNVAKIRKGLIKFFSNYLVKVFEASGDKESKKQYEAILKKIEQE